MRNTEFNCLPTIIGSMPHTDPKAACSLITRFLKDIPAWPQLPRRSFMENMYVQYSEGFPGVVIKEDSIKIVRSPEADNTLERLYAAYLENDIEKFPISPDYAAGFHAFLNLPDMSVRGVKGQITGPITWGLTVTDEEGRAIIYDDILGDAVPRLLRLKAAWQEQQLSKLSPNTIIFVDEPYMSAFGSVSMLLSKEKVVGMMDEVFSGIRGLKGVHCCGNTDWSVLLDTSTDIISFDAYGFAGSLSLYPREIKKFLDRKGAIAWGIIPTDEESLVRESVASLKDRLEEAMAPFTREGVPFRQLIKQGLLTPSCGLASLPTDEAAAHALEMLAELSAKIRERYT